MIRYSFHLFLATVLTLFSLDTSAGLLAAAPAPQFTPAQGMSDSAYGPGQQQYPPISQPDPNQPMSSVSGGVADQPSTDGAPSANDVTADQQHGVARLSIVQGDVNVKRGDNSELTAAIINAPLMASDHLQTSAGSRAEVELDYANLLRLGPDTEVGFATLEYHRYQIQLGAGTVVYRVLRNSDAQVEVDTPSVGFRPLGQGEFRISVLADGTTQVTARSGEGEIFGPRGSQRVPHGQTVLVRGNPSDPEFQTTGEIARDQLDDWCDHRDGELLGSQSYQHVSPDVYGADDLDAYGNWVPSQYGQVWSPQQTDPNWAPYSNGQWSWEDYYGWTWVDYSPWGWAPYHYGRWFMNPGHGWCWWPGAYRSSYYWSPALVGFFGWGGFGIGFGSGGLGWVALAPFESCHRWWGGGWDRGGYGYGRYGNFARGINVDRTYRNAAFRGGAVTAPYNSFGGPHGRFSFATRGQLANANGFRGGGIPIAPSRGSYQFSNRQVVANPRLVAAGNRQFFGSTQFRNAQLGGSQFGRAQATFGSPNRGGAGYAVTPSTHGVAPNLRNSRSGSYSVSPYSTRSGVSGGVARQGGWQRFGDPGNSGSLRQSFTGGAADQSGWHRFGQPQSSGGTSRYPSTSGSYGASRATSPVRPGSSSSYGAQNYNARPLTSAPSNNGARYGAPGSGNAYRGGTNPVSPRYSSPSGSYGGYSGPRSSPSYSAPRYSGPSGSYGGYSAPRSSPSYSAPRYSAPSGSYGAPRSGGPAYGSGGGARYSAPAPSRSGGGGGGSFRSSGGGGGGHPSGGGGGHHR